MKPNFNELTTVIIHPGEICFSENEIVISTVLGSCLAISMFSRTIKYAGISHCQLPACNSRGIDCNNCPDPFKYVDCTITQMLKKFEQRQIDRKDIEIKIFGGADVLDSPSVPKRGETIGAQNINSALKTLSANNLSIAASDVGGKQGRKLFFLTETGEIYLNRIKSDG
jgi:chemotaxis protein CheD